jgi:hypothetical protein
MWFITMGNMKIYLSRFRHIFTFQGSQKRPKPFIPSSSNSNSLLKIVTFTPEKRYTRKPAANLFTQQRRVFMKGLQWFSFTIVIFLGGVHQPYGLPLQHLFSGGLRRKGNCDAAHAQ